MAHAPGAGTGRDDVSTASPRTSGTRAGVASDAEGGRIERSRELSRVCTAFRGVALALPLAVVDVIGWREIAEQQFTLKWASA